MFLNISKSQPTVSLQASRYSELSSPQLQLSLSLKLRMSLRVLMMFSHKREVLSLSGSKLEMRRIRSYPPLETMTMPRSNSLSGRRNHYPPQQDDRRPPGPPGGGRDRGFSRDGDRDRGNGSGSGPSRGPPRKDPRSNAERIDMERPNRILFVRNISVRFFLAPPGFSYGRRSFLGEIPRGE